MEDGPVINFGEELPEESAGFIDSVTAIVDKYYLKLEAERDRDLVRLRELRARDKLASKRFKKEAAEHLAAYSLRHAKWAAHLKAREDQRDK